MYIVNFIYRTDQNIFNTLCQQSLSMLYYLENHSFNVQ